MQNVSDFLGHGAEHAIPAATLAAVANVTQRELRRRIMVERDSGTLILYQPGGSKAGYYLPSLDPEQAEQEVAAFYRVQWSTVVFERRFMLLNRPKSIFALPKW